MISLAVRYGHYGMGYFYDPTYILIIIAGIVSLIAQGMVKSRYAKYSRVRNKSGITGAQAAMDILRSQGIYDVTVQHVSGNLTDHFDPRNKTVNLSDGVYNSSSIAAVAIAAHECGHAVQHNTNYAPLSFRAALVPIANLGSKLSWIFIIAGIILSFNQTLLYIGIFMFSAAVLFQLVTLPVEFNASARALKIVSQTGMLYEDEMFGAKRVLTAAALTYVAAAATAILQLLRLIILFGGRDRD